MLLIISVILTCLVALGLVKLIDKFLPSGARPVVSILLWVATFFLAYLIYESVMKPIRFDEAKNERYKVAVQTLIDLKKAQLGYKKVNGEYADSFDKLVAFIDNGTFDIITRKDTTIIDRKKNKAFNLTVNERGEGGFFKDTVIINKIGTVSVKDSLFSGNDRYKRLNSVKFNEIEVPVEMKTGFVYRNETKLPVLEATIDKNALLADLDQDLLAQENKVEDINEINGDKIILGSLVDVTLSGNWPKRYGNND
ncbi:hypothetical protein [Flavobacterium sp. NRK F7]|uniref:hypothetical protein n=1 Tax=Flavobacterium sp. NRK F7 TaxID=2954930 RepID=UPI0020917713|nr:hypothetical protein [Flavobacterium sp. NRK F7]MCO6163478.1 hypothetical protein [Flavobacterium sp. NRK F7]|tara:strand:- start:134 stop:892 length:759 start_codon:yes stop_codon:yes gene_type:complete